MNNCDDLLLNASRSTWDVAVLGAGPAGSIAAYELAKRGMSVLLIDRAKFPRDKVCGGCLNSQAVADLARCGLWGRLSGFKAPLINRVNLYSDNRSTSLEIPQGLAISRFHLDTTLAEAAVSEGACFLSGVRVDLNRLSATPRFREIFCSTAELTAKIQSRIVILATGLPMKSSQDPNLVAKVARDSRMGIGCLISDYPKEYLPGTIFMAVGKTGYVGLTRLDGDRLNIAAAVDSSALRNASDPGGLCRQIVSDAGLPVSDAMFSGAWRGTLSLTRHRKQPASHRLFAVGDSAGYVEPFTGAGMAWAIRSGHAVVPFVERGIHQWDHRLVTQWSKALRCLLGGEQRSCRWLARFLRYPRLVRSTIHAMNHFPALGRAAVRHFNHGSSHEFCDMGLRNSSSATSNESGRRSGHVNRTHLRK